MRVSLIVVFCCGLGCIGLVFGKPFPDYSEKDLQTLTDEELPVRGGVDMKKFFDRFFVLIDKEKVLKFFIDKFTNDPEAKGVLHYLRGQKAKKIVQHIMNDPEYVKFVRWCYDNGMTNIYNEIRRINAFFGWEKNDVNMIFEGKVNGQFAQSIQTLFEELLDVLPMNAWITLSTELIQNEDAAAIALVKRLRESAMAEAWTRLKNIPEAQELGQALIEGGLAIELIIIIIESYFGWA